MKIVITNTVVLNTGDAAILFGAIRILKDAFGEDTEFTMYDSQPEIASRYYPEFTFRKLLYHQATLSHNRVARRLFKPFNLARFRAGEWCWSRKLRFLAGVLLRKEEIQGLTDYAEADLVISTGGTYLVENYLLKPRIFDFKLTARLNKPLVLFTQSLGPFHIKYNRIFFKKLFEAASLILLRDQQSQDNILDLNVKATNSFVTADAAFALADRGTLRHAAVAAPSLPVSPRFAISVRDWVHFKTIDPAEGRMKYFHSIVQLCVHLIDRYDAHITFISTCQGIREYWTDDSRTAAEIYLMIPAQYRERIEINEDFHSPEDLMNVVQAFDLAVSTRLHMAILALGAGVPVIPIAYEFKTRELFKRFGMERYVLDIETITMESLINQTDDYIRQLPFIQRVIFAKVEEEHRRAADACLYFKPFVSLSYSKEKEPGIQGVEQII